MILPLKKNYFNISLLIDINKYHKIKIHKEACKNIKHKTVLISKILFLIIIV